MLGRITLVALFLSPLFVWPAWAAPVSDAALGSQLAGGTVTVTRSGGSLSSATFVADGTGASATAPGSGGFSLTVSAGDTATATWTLTNTDPSLIFLNNITAVSIDLTLSGLSLFDSGSDPSTPDSGPGIPGVTHVGGVGFGAVTDLLSWPDPANLGDMFRGVAITFGAAMGAGAMSSWNDDTDRISGVPEPHGLVVLAAGLLLFVPLARATRRRGPAC
jgi:hypothetical protein